MPKEPRNVRLVVAYDVLSADFDLLDEYLDAILLTWSSIPSRAVLKTIVRYVAAATVAPTSAPYPIS
jgi:hypothetical protein